MNLINKRGLLQFLMHGNEAGYASGESGKKEADGSTTIAHELGSWRMHDNFFGGEPYGGREVVFFEGKPVWMMVYYGWVDPSATDIKNVYAFLQKALKQMPEDAPFRGPKELTDGEFKYENSWEGDLERFSGQEIILQNDKEIYRARYMGGLVDQRKE